MNIKSFLSSALLLVATAGLCEAQTQKSQIVEKGGTGPLKAVVVADASLPGFTIYRPADLKTATATCGRMPVILYANGGCANNNVEMRNLLNELASYGYVAIAIGPYDEDDPSAKWEGVLKTIGAKDKEMVLANGKTVKRLSEKEIEAEMAKIQAAIKRDSGNRPATNGNQPFRTYPKQLLEAMDWITDQNADPSSEYYHCVNLDQVAGMGQSCGGAQVLAVAHDPRIKTCVILNSGIGDMQMQGATPASLENLHQPMLYLIGGPDDVAFPNAKKDFELIKGVPVVMINTTDGHCGTYYAAGGGEYAEAVNKWLAWQFKGGEADLFLSDEALVSFDPSWSVVRKNIR